MKLDEIMKQLNTVKSQTEKKIILFDTLISIIGLVLLILLGSTGFAFIVIVLWIVSIIVFNSNVIKTYKSTFKNTLIPIALKQIGEDITYEEEGLSKETAEMTGMFGTFSIFHSEDTVRGNLSEVNFTTSDVRLGYMISTGKSTTYVPVCHGPLYIFDFNKKFKAKTIVREKFGAKPSGLVKLKLESETFNKQFKVFSENELDAFYLLTPHFMEKLLQLEEKHEGDLFIAFYQNQLHIGIHNNLDRFKVPLFTTFDLSTFEDQLNDLYLIKEIIDELKLNQKIFID